MAERPSSTCAGTDASFIVECADCHSLAGTILCLNGSKEALLAQCVCRLTQAHLGPGIDTATLGEMRSGVGAAGKGIVGGGLGSSQASAIAASDGLWHGTCPFCSRSLRVKLTGKIPSLSNITPIVV